MRHILWVNDLTSDLLGRVYNIETFNKNVAKLKCKKELEDALNGLTEKGEGTFIYKIAGRYFCIIEVHFEESLRKMIFIDYQKRDDIAIGSLAASHKPDEKNAKDVTERFFQAYSYYKEIYDEGYNDVELKVDTIALN